MKQRSLMYLLFFPLLLANFFSCTEKVSKDLEGVNLTAEEKTKAQFKNKSIRLVDKNREDLSFMLHKAGSLSSACSIVAPTNGFSSSTYDKTSKVYTADCILDVQEFDLYFHGINLQLQVDEHLCEYIQYKPFRFLKHATGSTHKKHYAIECDEECGKNYGSYCNRKFNTRLAVPSYGKFDPRDLSTIFADPLSSSIDAQLFCEFDHGGPNCDEGRITTIKYKLESEEVPSFRCSDGSPDNTTDCEAGGNTMETILLQQCTHEQGAENYPLFSPGDDEVYECGGSITACLGGPGADELSAGNSGTIYNNESLAYFEKDMKVESPISKGYYSNMYAANFSRVCSSTGESKTDLSKFDTSLFNIIGHEVENMPDRKTFNSYVVDTDDNGSNDYTSYSHHAFKGAAYYTRSTYNIQPYYAYECLDQARDIKAQIRIFVREWDKVFEPTNPYIARLSDINQANPQMDADTVCQHNLLSEFKLFVSQSSNLIDAVSLNPNALFSTL